MKKRLKYTGILKTGKPVKGTLEIKAHRKVKDELNHIGRILLKRYKKEELPMTEFKLEKA